MNEVSDQMKKMINAVNGFLGGLQSQNFEGALLLYLLFTYLITGYGPK